MEDNRNLNPTQETPEIPESVEVPETQPGVVEGQPSPMQARSKKWFIIGGVLIVFLAVAAFLGARLLKPQAAVGSGDNGMMLVSKGGGAAGAGKSVRLNMTPAKELPQGRPDTNGLFVRREDQSIFIGTGNVRMTMSKGSNGAGSTSGSYDGPVVEVVINHQTKLYQDITEMATPDQAKDGEVTMQQVVKPGALDDIGKNSMVTVWGDKQGDRFIARVIAFR